MHKKHNIDFNSLINKPQNPITCRETGKKSVQLFNSEALEENIKTFRVQVHLEEMHAYTYYSGF